MYNYFYILLNYYTYYENKIKFNYKVLFQKCCLKRLSKLLI